MRKLIVSAIASLIVLILIVSPVVAADNAQQEEIAKIGQALETLELSSSGKILEMLETGLVQQHLMVDKVIHVLEQLASYQAVKVDKEKILLSVARAAPKVPIGLLIDKVEEGIARGIGPVVIQEVVARRSLLLAEARDLLYEKRIFRGANEEASFFALPAERFDQLVTQVAAAIAEYLEAGGSPLEGHKIYEKINSRLSALARGEVIPLEDVKLVIERIDPTDLTRISLGVLDQL